MKRKRLKRKKREDRVMSVKNKRFCFFILETELSDLKQKAKSLGLNTSEFIRDRIFQSHKKAKEQYIIRSITTINELKNILLELSLYIKTYRSIDIYALEVLCEIDTKLSELKNDL